MPIQKICQICLQIYYHKPSRVNSKFCSRRCHNISNGRMNGKIRCKKIQSICLHCGKSFLRKLSKKDAKYCSRTCKNTNVGLSKRLERETRTCKACGKNFNYLPKPSRPFAGIYCSDRCKCNIRIGSKKGSWLDRATPEQKISDLTERYNKFVIRSDECWGWLGTVNKDGYAKIGFNKRIINGHRASWMIHKSLIPEKMYVLHTCDNPPCTNPEHLYLGTPKDNARDMIIRNRQQYKHGENHPSATITNQQAKEIKSLLDQGFRVGEIQKKSGIKRHIIDSIKFRKNWKTVI